MNLFSRFRKRERLKKEPSQENAPAKQGNEPYQCVRWLIRRDMPEVLAIENASFASPWTEHSFLQCLQKRNCIGMVAEYNARIVGFLIYELHKKELRITNFAVDPEFRNMGFGRMMMQKMLEKVGQQRHDRIVILLPDECTKNRPFFMRCGGGVVRIQTTDTKGLVGVEIAIKSMKSKHVVRVQMIEDECLEGNARNIASMLGHGTQGAIAVNTRGIEGDNIIGYILWDENGELPNGALVVHGAVGQITHPDYLHRGVGHALMHHIASFNKPVIVRDIDLKDKDRCHFLRDIGVPVPELCRYMTVEWNGKPAA